MVTAEEYLKWVLARVVPTQVHTVPVGQAHGFALGAAVSAAVDLPLWDSSAMDGYAIHAADLARATAQAPARLRVIGEVAAGDAADPVMPAGTAVRIMTGAAMPSAASAVVPIERTHGGTHESPATGGWSDDEVWIAQPVPVGANVRQQGEDLWQGDTIAQAGDELTAARLSAIAAAGIGEVLVHRAVRIAVVSTGSELRAAGSPLRRGEIPESNSILLAGLLREAGCAAVTIEHCADNAEVLEARLAALAAEHDAVITTGGVGPGKYDVVRIALAREPEIRAMRVAVRPGQPQCSGRHSAGAFVFGLPGNPVSTAVSFELFVRPALRVMAGLGQTHRRAHMATVSAGWPGKSGSLQVLPVTLTATQHGLTCAPAVSPTGVSHAVGRHGFTDGYALVEADRGSVAVGETVCVIETGLA